MFEFNVFSIFSQIQKMPPEKTIYLETFLEVHYVKDCWEMLLKVFGYWCQRYVKSVRVWSCSGPHFPTYGVSLRIQSECGKMRTRITPNNTDTFHAVHEKHKEATKGIIINIYKISHTPWKVSVFGVILVRIFPHSDQNSSDYGHFLRSASVEVNKINYPSLEQNDSFLFWMRL